MSEPKSLFTEMEIERARTACKGDSYVNEICVALRMLYCYNLPADAEVFWSGQVKLHLTPVMAQMAEQLRGAMRMHIQAHYPALSHIYTPIIVDGNVRTWSDPVDKPAPLGEFLVITEHDYCIKAMHYGNNDWQLSETGKQIQVLLYGPLPEPPPGNKYRSQGVLIG